VLRLTFVAAVEICCQFTDTELVYLLDRCRHFKVPARNQPPRLSHLLTPYTPTRTLRSQDQPGIERVQAFADISRSALCCRSNETRAPIASPPNNTQLEGHPLLFLQLISGSVQ